MAKRKKTARKAKAAGRVIVVGSSNTDLVVHCDRLPGAGETVLGGDLQEFAGGKGANQAVAAARAGAKTFFIGAFGDDAFGAARRRDLEADRIDTSGCVVKKKTPSGVALIAIGAAGSGKQKTKAENLIVVAPGANAKLTPADVKRGMPTDLNEKDVVLCSLEVPFDCVRAAFELGLKRGAETVLNPAPCPEKGLPAALMRLASIITPNETEAALLAGRRSIESFTYGQLTTGHTTHLLVTRGDAGVREYFAMYRLSEAALEALQANADEDTTLVLDENTPGLSKPDLGHEDYAAPKVKPVDTVGAGDCFNGALAAHLANHADEIACEGAIEFAVTAASIAVTRHGAQAGMPKRAEILRLLKKRGR